MVFLKGTDGLIKKGSVGSSHAGPTQCPDKILNDCVLQFGRPDSIDFKVPEPEADKTDVQIAPNREDALHW